MAFFAQQIRTQPIETTSPHPKFAITQLKFPLKSSNTIFNIRKRPHTHTDRDTTGSYQSKRLNSYRADREKKIERLSNGLRFELPGENEEDVKARMFMTWKERSHSSKQIIVPMNKIIQEVLKNKLTHTPQRSLSQKKMPQPKYDLDLRRNDVQTANRPIGRSPMELLTRKLEWRGKQKKRVVFFEPKVAKSSNAIRSVRLEGRPLLPLTGWQDKFQQEFVFEKIY